MSKEKDVVITIMISAMVIFIVILLFTCCRDATLSGEKPLTKQICSYGGFSSEAIIEEEAEEGYIFTGTTKTFACDNMLNFQLIEGIYSDKTEDEEAKNDQTN